MGTLGSRGWNAAYAVMVVLGSVLLLWAALNQPFSYDELNQIGNYRKSWGEALSGTVGPLASLPGVVAHKLLGEGHLQQRLVPVLSSVGSLVVMALLLRRLGLRGTGVLALLLMATSPLFLQYGVYTRPYALPQFVMLLTAYGAHRWLTAAARGWLLTAVVGALALPLIRASEADVFLLVLAGALILFVLLGRLHRRRTAWLVGACFLGLLVAGTQTVLLADTTQRWFDPSPTGIAERFDKAVHELLHSFLPVLAGGFPWWPLVLAVVVLALAVPDSRRRLLGCVFWWPLLAVPVAFAVAYHFLNTLAFDALPYRERYASFFLAPFVLLVAALLRSAVGRPDLRALVSVLVAGIVLCQLPGAWRVLTQDASPDFDAIAEVLHEKVPDDAIVLYDRAAPAPQSRQHFPGRARYVGSEPLVQNVTSVARRAEELPDTGPVYLLFNGQCAYLGRCVPGRRHAVDVEIPGWQIVHRQDRFTLYAPRDPGSPAAQGHAGMVNALLGTARALPTQIGYLQTYAAAALLRADGQDQRADALVSQLESRVDADLAERIEVVDGYYDFLEHARGEAAAQ